MDNIPVHVFGDTVVEEDPGEDFLAGCMGKSSFDSWDQANRAVRRKHGKKRAVTIYRCRHCRKYHIAGIFKATPT